MAYTMSYASLLVDARRYLERGDATTDPIVYAQLPRLIAFAEKRIARELKIQLLEQYVYWTMQADVAVYQKPDLWRETKSLKYGVNATAAATGYNTRAPLFPRELEYCRSYWPDPTISSVDEPPRFYAEYGNGHILIVPTPALAYPSEWAYWQLAPPLSDENQTNILTRYAPELLLYATLLESQPFLKDDDRIAVWQSMFDRASAGFLKQDARKAQDAAVKPEEGVQ